MEDGTTRLLQVWSDLRTMKPGVLIFPVAPVAVVQAQVVEGREGGLIRWRIGGWTD